MTTTLKDRSALKNNTPVSRYEGVEKRNRDQQLLEQVIEKQSGRKTKRVCIGDSNNTIFEISSDVNPNIIIEKFKQSRKLNYVV